MRPGIITLNFGFTMGVSGVGRRASATDKVVCQRLAFSKRKKNNDCDADEEAPAEEIEVDETI
jgi:hypothetical protein